VKGPGTKAGDINILGCDYNEMLTPPFGNTPEQIEAGPSCTSSTFSST